MSTTPSQIDAGAYRWHPTREMAEQSNLRAFLDNLGLASYQDLLALSNHDPDRFWRAVLDFADIRFFRPYDAISDLSRGLPWARWCVGGTTNVVLNVLDRHMEEGRGGATAITWVAETGGTKVWTYDELNRQTCRIAAGLDRLGCRSGDVVALYLPSSVLWCCHCSRALAPSRSPRGSMQRVHASSSVLMAHAVVAKPSP